MNGIQTRLLFSGSRSEFLKRGRGKLVSSSATSALLATPLPLSIHPVAPIYDSTRTVEAASEVVKATLAKVPSPASCNIPLPPPARRGLGPLASGEPNHSSGTSRVTRPLPWLATRLSCIRTRREEETQRHSSCHHIVRVGKIGTEPLSSS